MYCPGIVIKVDNRETDLIPLIESRIETYLLEPSSPPNINKGKNGCLVPLHMFQDVEVSNHILPGEAGEATEARENRKFHKMKIEQLHIGDVIFEDDSGKPIIIFERKTLNDLAASIKDGRYSEQSFRLDKEPAHNHNIIYIIEGDIERYLIPKFLKPKENAQYLSKIIMLSSRSFYNGLREIFSDPVKSILLLKASVYFYSRATYSNYLLAERVQEFCLKGNVNTLVLTLEGHSYEQYLIEKVKKRHADLSIMMYQHSPIVLDQFGVVQFLKTNNIFLYVLTTGTLYKNMFKNISSIPQYIVFGSKKAELNFIDKKTNFENHVLFAPEGTSLATVSFLKLANYLCSNTQNFTFCVRLHPNFRLGFSAIYLIRKLNKKSNFLLSNNSLYEDLQKSNFVFYRSSAVGVECLKSKALPVFYGEPYELGLNVLGNLLIKLPIAVTQEEALIYLLTPNRDISKLERKKIFNEIFSKIDYKKLGKVMKI